MAGIHGLLYNNGKANVIKQIIVQNPVKEKQELEEVYAIFSKASAIVTFAGKSFDGPLYNRRRSVHLLKPLDFKHIDVMKYFMRYARKRSYPNYKQVEFERSVLGIDRKAGIEGKDIPRVVEDYIAGIDSSRMMVVLERNRLDLITTLLVRDYFRKQILEEENL